MGKQLTMDDLKGLSFGKKWTDFEFLLKIASFEYDRECRRIKETQERSAPRRMKEKIYVSEPVENMFTGLKENNSDEYSLGSSATEETERTEFKQVLTMKRDDFPDHKERVLAYDAEFFKKIDVEHEQFGPCIPNKSKGIQMKRTTLGFSENYDTQKKNGKMSRKPRGTVIREPTETTSQDSATQKMKRRRGSDSINKEEKPKTRIKKNKVDLSDIKFPSELPMELNNVFERMNGTDLMEVIRKALTYSDLTRNHGRLSIPPSQLENEFLTSEEKQKLEAYRKSSAKEKPEDLKVILIDPSLREWSLNMRSWEMSGNWIYALLTKWNDVVKANELKEDDVIQLWAFRSESRLYFVLVVVRKACEEGTSGSDNGGSGTSTSGTKNEEAAMSQNKDDGEASSNGTKDQ